MKFHFVLSKISYYFTKQSFSDSKQVFPIFPQEAQEYTSGIIPPPVPGGGHPMSASSLKLELLYFSEEYQQALDTGWTNKQINKCEYLVSATFTFLDSKFALKAMDNPHFCIELSVILISFLYYTVEPVRC